MSLLTYIKGIDLVKFSLVRRRIYEATAYQKEEMVLRNEIGLWWYPVSCSCTEESLRQTRGTRLANSI